MREATVEKLRIVALLPMKAHSERVMGKNFKDFCGKPLFRWILDSLISIKAIDQIIINTDARDLLAYHGLVDTDRILIRDRRPEICGDLVSMNLVLADDVANTDADIYLMTHTTNPLLKADTISDSLSAFITERSACRADSLFTVTKIQNRFYHSDGTPVNHDPSNLVRTQDLEPWYEENSNLYIFTSDSFLKTNARIGKSPILYETSKHESIDIDTPSDWEFAIAIARHILKIS